jgi:hypothetical protein
MLGIVFVTLLIVVPATLAVGRIPYNNAPVWVSCALARCFTLQHATATLSAQLEHGTHEPHMSHTRQKMALRSKLQRGVGPRRGCRCRAPPGRPSCWWL